MNIYIDLDTLTLIQSPTDRRTVSRLDIKRGDHSPFTIRFLRAGLPVRLGASTVLTFAAKENGKFDAAAVSLFDDFAQSAIPTAPAPDSDPHWTGAPSFNTVELNALFDIDADPDNDPPFVDIMAEFTWQATGDAGPTTSRTFGIRVLNDVFRGDEDTPLALPTPEQWLSAQTSPILEALQGAENDPSRIGLEYLPGSLDSDITGAAVGESLIESLESVYAGTSGIFHFATTRANQGSFTVKTTSGYARLINANGSLGSVVAAVGGTITLTIPAAGGHRAYGVLSCNSAGAIFGSITEITIFAKQVTAIKVNSLSALTYLNLDGNYLVTFDQTGLSNLTYLHLGDNKLTSFLFSGQPSLQELYLHNNNLSEVGNLLGGPLSNNLQILSLGGNRLTSFPTTGFINLRELDLTHSIINTFSLSSAVSLTRLVLDATGLTNVSLAGLNSLNYVSMRQHYLSQAAHDAAFNSLPAAADDNAGFWDSTWDPNDSFLPSAASGAKRTAMIAGGWTLAFGTVTP
jgi:hypothetical protein